MKKPVKITVIVVSVLVGIGALYGSYHVGYDNGIDDQLAYDRENIKNIFSDKSESVDDSSASDNENSKDNKLDLTSQTQYGKIQLTTDTVEKLDNDESNYEDAEYNFDGKLPNQYYRITVNYKFTNNTGQKIMNPNWTLVLPDGSSYSDEGTSVDSFMFNSASDNIAKDATVTGTFTILSSKGDMDFNGARLENDGYASTADNMTFVDSDQFVLSK